MAGGPFTSRDQWGHPGTVDRTECGPVLKCIRKYADSVCETLFGSAVKLREAVSSGGYELVARTLDSDGVIVTASVLWPDGFSGVFTTLVKNSTFVVIDSYSVTYISASKTWTITQPTVTRDSSGEITTKPALVVV